MLFWYQHPEDEDKLEFRAQHVIRTTETQPMLTSARLQETKFCKYNIQNIDATLFI